MQEIEDKVLDFAGWLHFLSDSMRSGLSVSIGKIFNSRNRSVFTQLMTDEAASVPAGFQIEFEIKQSSISPEIGLGIFTKQFIPTGSLIWKYERGVNISSYRNKDEAKLKLEKLDPKEQDFFMSHVYLFDGVMNEILDDGKFWNHVSNLML